MTMIDANTAALAQMRMDASGSQRAAAGAGGGRTEQEVRAAAEELEGQFLAQMFKHMNKGVETDKGMFGGGHGEKMFRSMMADEYGKMAARSGGVGLADAITAQMLAQQEGK